MSYIDLYASLTLEMIKSAFYLYSELSMDLEYPKIKKRNSELQIVNSGSCHSK
jgi:hypothetical protein